MSSTKQQGCLAKLKGVERKARESSVATYSRESKGGSGRMLKREPRSTLSPGRAERREQVRMETLREKH